MPPVISFDSGFHNVINGELRSQTITSFGVNPITEERLWPVPVASRHDLDESVKAGRAAFQSWSRSSIDQRKLLVEAYGTAITEYEQEFTKLLMVETGRPVSP